MIFSTQTLEALFENQAYKTLHMALLSEAATPGNWQNTIEQLVEIVSKQVVWESAQCVALLFETYPDIINTVDLTYKRSTDGLFTSRVEINGEWCYYKHYPLFGEKLKAVDELAALDLALGRIETLTSDHLLEALPLIRPFVNHIFTSASEARRIASRDSPVVDRWVRRQLLMEQTHEAQPASAKPRNM